MTAQNTGNASQQNQNRSGDKAVSTNKKATT